MGLAGLLSHLLENEPKAFITDARKRKTLGPEESQKVLQRLTAGDASCHIIATPAPAGGDAVVCSARMAEIFLCPQELSRLLHTTGVASFFFWPMYVSCCQEGLSGGVFVCVASGLGRHKLLT